MVKGKIGLVFIVLGLILIFLSVATLSTLTAPVQQIQTPPESQNMVFSGFTEEEKTWIENHPVIRVSPDPSFPPFETIDKSGEYVGISADFLKLMSEKTGLQFAIVRQDNFTMSTRAVQEHTADMLGAVYISDLRDEYLTYSAPYYETPIVIIVNNSVSSPLSLDDLSGKTVVAIEGYTTTELLKNRYPDINLKPSPDTRTALFDVSLGHADAFLGDLPTATSLVESEGLVNLHVASEYVPKQPDQFSIAFGVRKDWPELAKILTKGIQMITPEERDVVMKRWVSNSLNPQTVNVQIIIAIFAGSGIFVIIIGGILIWNHSLQIAVHEKTRELSRELEERKRAEEALKMTKFSIDRASDMVIWIDAEGNILDTNDTVCKNLGYSHDEMSRMTIFDINPFLDSGRWTQIFKAVKNQGIRVIESVYTTRSGEQIPVEVSQNYFEYAGKEGNCSIIRDISERKRIKELQGAAFAQIDHNMEQFAILNDQIRNPLNIILCYASETDTPENYHIIEQVKKIDAIVHTLDKGWLKSEKVRVFLRKHYLTTDMMDANNQNE
ncbi:MAG: transporter substrate-binding domain-containing protein [Methanobacteriota archaeon]